MILYSQSAREQLGKIIVSLSDIKYKADRQLAEKYVDAILLYIEDHILHIGNPISKRNHAGFKGLEVRYIRYKRNSKTQWIVYYIKEGDDYLVIRITNNHIDHKPIKGF